MKRRYPQAIIDAAIAAYGRESASTMATKLGCSIGAVTRWWHEAKAAGTIVARFDRHDGATKAKRDAVVKRGGRRMPDLNRPSHAAGDDRPNCRQPEACTAAGSGHCRACACSAMSRKRFADPANIEKARLRLIAMNADPKVRKRQVAGFKGNRQAVRALSRSATARALAMRGDEVIDKRRADAVRASSAKRLARDLGIPERLVEEYRWIKLHKSMGRADALATVRASHPSLCAEHDMAVNLKRRRSLGPVPAIGMPERAGWTQAMAEGVGV